MSTRIGLDRCPMRCLKCGGEQFNPVGREFDTETRPGGYPALEFIECADCSASFRLPTLVGGQWMAPIRITSTINVRTTDPAPSHTAARLDFTQRRDQVIEALEHLGRADTASIAEWVNRQGYKPTDKASVARRLADLKAEGIAAKDGVGTNTDGNTATVWRLTKHKGTPQ